jgi:hypothetical protein
MLVPGRNRKSLCHVRHQCIIAASEYIDWIKTSSPHAAGFTTIGSSPEQIKLDNHPLYPNEVSISNIKLEHYGEITIG